MKETFKRITAVLCFITAVFLFLSASTSVSYAEMPFYGLNPQDRVLRAEFTTDYSKSSAERKHNISLAAKALDNAFIDVKSEFSFNKRVGARTATKGYKTAKIIVNGEFVEGIGGGVCQVSTTLYNAALLSGMQITEKHAHTLAVSYVEPSFDAMVNSGSADLKFVNCTRNPVIIKAKADGKKLTISILGEKMNEKIKLKSYIKGYVDADYEKVKDVNLEYPDLYDGEEKIVSYGKKGVKSEGYIIRESALGKKTEKIRTDYYAPINGLIVIGTAIKKEEKSDTNAYFSSDNENALFTA